MVENIVFLVSGGIDSTVGVAKAIEDTGCLVYPLYVKRGARAEEREILALNNLLPWLRSRYPSYVHELAFADIPFPKEEWKNGYPPKIVERLGHPMREVMLHAIGVQYAEFLNYTFVLGIRTVMVGHTSDEHYPHSQYYAQRLTSFLIQLDRDDEAWSIRSPFLWPKTMTKAQVVRWGLQHEIPLELTWSCIYGIDQPCHGCSGCRLREEAFVEEAKAGR